MGTYGFAEGECMNLFGRFVFSKMCNKILIKSSVVSKSFMSFTNFRDT